MKSVLQFQILSASLGVALVIGQPGFCQSQRDFNDYSQSFDLSSNAAASTATTNDTESAQGSSASTGDQSHGTIAHYSQQDQSDYSRPRLQQSCNGNLAGASVNNLPVPSGSYSFGFTGGIFSTVKSIFSKGGYLPPTSTGSVELTVAH